MRTINTTPVSDELEPVARKTVRIPVALDSALRHFIVAQRDLGLKTTETDVFIEGLRLVLDRANRPPSQRT